MIQSNELRLGNVISQRSYLGAVEGVLGETVFLKFFGGDQFQESVKNIEPIPLTPDILEKCGFEKDDEGFWLHDKDRMALQLERQDYTDGSFDYHCGIRFDIGMPFNDLLIGMQHVHQLQNLYHSLTGEELAITL